MQETLATRDCPMLDKKVAPNRRGILVGLLSSVGFSIPTAKAEVERLPYEPGDLIEISRHPYGYDKSGRILFRYQVRQDYSLRKVRTDGRRGQEDSLR